MPDTLDIEFTVKNFRAALQEMRQLKAETDGLAQSQKQLTAQASGGGKPTRFVQGPFQRRQALLQQQQLAVQQGNVNAQKDINLALSRNAQQLRRTQPATFAQRLMGVVRSSRFSLGGEGGGVQPLVGRVLDLFKGGEGGAGLLGGLAEGGAGAAAGEALGGGPTGIVLGALTLIASGAIKAAAGLTKFAQQAAQASQEFQGLRFSTGGTTAETARLGSVGSALGLSPGAVGGLAAGLQDRISTDGFAMATGLRAGVYNLQQPFGKTDTAGQLVQALKFLRSETGDAQIRDARTLGLESALPGIANLSNKQFNLAGQDANVSFRIFNPRFAQQSADLEASVGRVSQSVQNLLAALAPVVIDKLTSFFNGLATKIEEAAGYVSAHQAMFVKIIDVVEALGEAVVGDYTDAMRHLDNITSGKDDKLVNALDANTSATQANTAGLGQPGVYGDISRNTGLPAFGYGNAIRRNGDQAGYRLGIYFG